MTENWYTDLQDVANVGSTSIFIALDELLHSGKVQIGQKILLLVPESSGFSYVAVMLSVE